MSTSGLTNVMSLGVGFVSETCLEMMTLKGIYRKNVPLNGLKSESFLFISEFMHAYMAQCCTVCDILILLFIILKRLMTYLGNHMLTGFVVICVCFLFFSCHLCM